MQLRKECKDTKDRVSTLEEQLAMASRQLNAAHDAELKFQRDIEEVLFLGHIAVLLLKVEDFLDKVCDISVAAIERLALDLPVSQNRHFNEFET